MFLIDTSPSMGKLRTVQLPPGPSGEERTTEITSLEWVLQLVKLKIQEMIYSGRKTDQCGVVVFGSERTDNIINEDSGGYNSVSDYIPIAQPSAATLSKLDLLEASDKYGDPLDAIMVGIETQAAHLASRKTWDRKIVLVTDGESPIEVEHRGATVNKMNSLDISFTVIGVDFDSEDFGYTEDDKKMKLMSKIDRGVVGTCEEALQETARPDIKQIKSVLMGTLLRLGDVDTKPDEAIELVIKTSKCTAMSRPKSWKKLVVLVSDLSANPLPPPHPELLKYFDPPKRVLKRSRDALEECKNTLKVKQVPKKVARTRKDGHAHAQDEDDNLLLEGKEPSLHQTMS
ncbi:hypothetical protein C0993_008503 [Termitomyces sp. T159_Od127]|nr:hypothetical protein C0993_008503 [Termitomyces sp. T159_Od127]